MKRTFLIGAAIAAASLTAIWAFAGAPSTRPARPLLQLPTDRGGSFDTYYSVLGDVRILTVTPASSMSTTFSHTDAQGVMATRMRVTAVVDGLAQYFLVRGGGSPELVFNVVITPGSSTVEYTFDPPLRIGEGMSSAFAASELGFLVEFYGTALPPPRIGGETLVVE